jgi:hypothetical protein
LASDTKGLPLTYTLVNPPPGATIDPASGLLQFSAQTTGAYSLAISVNSSSGVAAVQTFQFTVCPIASYWMNGMGGMCM